MSTDRKNRIEPVSTPTSEPPPAAPAYPAIRITALVAEARRLDLERIGNTATILSLQARNAEITAELSRIKVQVTDLTWSGMPPC